MSAPPGTRPATLLDAVAARVRTQAEALAITDDDGHEFTYGELDARADALARVLRDLGVGRDDVVAIHMRRGAGVVVAMLATLRAGAGYMAVDVRYPDHIRDHMLRDARARVVVTQPDWRERVAALGPFAVVDWTQGRADGPAPPPPDPANVACVLYTSGSTGLPKGIVLEHRQLLEFVCNEALPPLRADDRVAQIASISFDPINFEVWCTLIAGARIAVLPDFPHLLAADLRRELKLRGVTVMLGPAIGINQAVRDDPHAFDALRILHSGGDVLLPRTCRQLLQSGFAGELYNLYGPAETTTACSQYRVTSVPDDLPSVPIGHPLEGFALYVLDGDLRPVAPGTPGELYVGGPGVGRGYLGKPGLTAERFVPDPFAGAGARMYASGDTVRALPDGALEFLGRSDDQVKILGYRVELTAIERALCLHQEIREASVLAVGEPSSLSLVAFVVPDGDLVSLSDVRRFLSERLPEYMVPADFVRLQAMPTNEHGKRSRQELERMLEARQQQRAEYVAARDDVERYLVQLWEELLMVANVSVLDDFFTLGGHSLMAFRMHSSIRRELGVELPFKRVFDHTVLADLAELVRTTREQGEAAVATGASG